MMIAIIKGIRLISLVILTIFCMVSTTAQEEDGLISIRFSSTPSGASIFLDDSLIGVTPTEVQIKPGQYSVRFSLPGFIDWQDSIVLYNASNGVSVNLQSGDELIRVHTSSYGEWDNHANRIRLLVPHYEEPARAVTYDIDLGTIDSPSAPLNWLEDDVLRQELNIGMEENSIFSVAYESPSGRYIGYVPENDEPTLFLYDRELDVNIPTDIKFSTFSDSITPRFSLQWSPNEQFVYVKDTVVTADCKFIMLDGDEVTSWCVRGFDLGLPMPIEWFLGTPNNDGKVLFLQWDSETSSHQLWMVDLTNMQTTPLPFQDVLDAVFSLDDANIIYVVQNAGLTRYNLITYEEARIDSLIDALPVQNATLAPTLDYALLELANGDNASYWIYRLPHLQEQP